MNWKNDMERNRRKWRWSVTVSSEKVRFLNSKVRDPGFFCVMRRGENTVKFMLCCVSECTNGNS